MLFLTHFVKLMSVHKYSNVKLTSMWFIEKSSLIIQCRPTCPGVFHITVMYHMHLLRTVLMGEGYK